MRSKKVSQTDETTELLRKLLIVQLGLAGVPQRNIRAIVGVDLNRVPEIMKLVNPKENKKAAVGGS